MFFVTVAFIVLSNLALLFLSRSFVFDLDMELIRKASVFFIFSLFAWKKIDQLKSWLERAWGQERRWESFLLHRALQFIFLFLAAFLLADLMGIHPKALLAIGGLGGIALGFAAKDIVANFFGALVLFFQGSFCEGDWLKLSFYPSLLRVEKMGLYNTSLRSSDGHCIYAPNSLFIQSSIENLSRIDPKQLSQALCFSIEKEDFKIKAFLIAFESWLGLRKEVCKHPLPHFTFVMRGSARFVILLNLSIKRASLRGFPIFLQDFSQELKLFAKGYGLRLDEN